MADNSVETPDKKRFFRHKVIIAILLFVIIIQASWIYFSGNWAKLALLPNYSFTDLGEDGLIIAKGSWISTIDLAFPIQTIYLECWKQFNHCWIIDATFDEETKYLSLGSEVKEINRWDRNAIETVPSKTPAECVEYLYRIDRRSQTVTSVRNTIDNTSELCQGIQKEPIISHLADGNKKLQR